MSDAHPDKRGADASPLERAKLMLEAKAVVEHYDRIIETIDEHRLVLDRQEADFVMTVEDYRTLRDFACRDDAATPHGKAINLEGVTGDEMDKSAERAALLTRLMAAGEPRETTPSHVAEKPYRAGYLDGIAGKPPAESLLAVSAPSTTRPIEGRAACPDCYRFKARNADDCAAGDCSKWYAIRDKEADADCIAFKNKTGYYAASATACRPVTDDQPPIGESVLLWLVTINPVNSGWVQGTRSAYSEVGSSEMFWDGHRYRPMAWVSHWHPLPAAPEKFERPNNSPDGGNERKS